MLVFIKIATSLGLAYILINVSRFMVPHCNCIMLIIIELNGFNSLKLLINYFQSEEYVHDTK